MYDTSIKARIGGRSFDLLVSNFYTVKLKFSPEIKRYHSQKHSVTKGKTIKNDI